MILCIEGGDGSGKTTLCRHLVETHGARYMHARVWKNMTRWHLGIMRYAQKLHRAGELVVLDRHWVSEFIYGPIFRGEPAYDNLLASAFDTAIRTYGGYVMCVPSDLQGQIARHAARRANGKEMFDTVEKVCQFYADLVYGNVAHPGDTFLDKYVRFGDFMKQSAIRYDFDEVYNKEACLHAFARKLVKGDWL